MSDPSNPLSLRFYDNLADRIRQHRQADTRPIVIVEGPTDEDLLVDTFGEMWVYFSAAGRPNALEAIKATTQAGVRNVFCVVDRDFDEDVSACERAGIPIVAYRNADMEAMLATEDTLKVVLRSFGREGVEELDLAAILDHVAELTQPISRLRRANHLNGWGLNFDETEPADKIDQRTLVFNIVGYCQALSRASNDPPDLATLISVASGKTAIRMPSCPHGVKYYFNGKDFAAILGVFLRKKLGALSKSQTERRHVSAIVRSSASGRVRKDPWAAQVEQIVGPAF
ncbi:DUF4435 domain-containing protein [Streptomyces massasporeus]|uniref:DUF4435 domain-containing protein n=1 Tax=Streptomyces massasporeus TaxID=67324 RepID=UPI0033BF55DD